ncbi:WD40 repeat-like protein [Clavulina sp. PMI_390]|nr:WD40 repeat-like protein [Clavulina sp. PMI_390]
MHLGRSKPKPVDLSKALWDSDAFSPRPIKRLGLNGDITAMAVEPLTGMLAFGTDRGSVHLYGAPSVTAEVAVSSAPSARIRFIAFAQSCSQMAVIDSRNFVTVYDLASPRRPTVSSSFELNQRAMALTTSPSHSHAFIALADGQCLVYDLERGQPSPYAIPNLWEAEEIKEGHYRSRQSAPNPALVDVLIHPRNLNSLLLVYDAGVIVWDIADRKAARIFRGVVPLRERELRDITSAAIHPLGIVFTLGHMDGSLSFWALDHDERPLSIHYLPSPTASPNAEREPIFKLAWSAFPSLEECKALLDQATSTQAEGVSLPRLAGSTLDYSGGETVLTLLGGLLLDEPAGARTLQIAPLHLPSLDPTKTEAETYIAELSTKFTIIGFDWIPASYPVDDFVLLPRSSPHYAGAFDPISILQSFKWGSGNSARSAVDALEFPPPLSATPMQQKAYNHGDPIKPLEIPLPQVNPNTLTQFRVPGIFSSGNDTVLGVQLRNIPKRPFARLLREWVEAGAAEDAEGALPSRRIPLRAGEARGAASSSTVCICPSLSSAEVLTCDSYPNNRPNNIEYLQPFILIFPFASGIAAHCSWVLQHYLGLTSPNTFPI